MNLICYSPFTFCWICFLHSIFSHLFEVGECLSMCLYMYIICIYIINCRHIKMLSMIPPFSDWKFQWKIKGKLLVDKMLHFWFSFVLLCSHQCFISEFRYVINLLTYITLLLHVNACEIWLNVMKVNFQFTALVPKLSPSLNARNCWPITVICCCAKPRSAKNLLQKKWKRNSEMWYEVLNN